MKPPSLAKLLPTALVLLATACSARPLPQASQLVHLATSSPSKVPTQSPVPTTPSLTSPGPWLLFPRLEPPSSWTPVVASIHLSQTFALDAPVIQGDDVSYNQGFMPNAVSPNGGLIAIRAQGTPYQPQLWIYRLPSTSPVAKLSTISPQAEQEQRSFPLEGQPSHTRIAYNPTYSAILGPHSFRWSSDGRYLAYSSAISGHDTDLFVFDSQVGDSRQLTDEDGEVLVLGWSPSSREVLFAVSHDVDLYTGYDPFQLSAYDLTNSRVNTLQSLTPRGAPYFEIAVLGWPSNDQVILYDTGYEGGQRDLRLIDVDDPSVTPLRDGYALRPGFDSGTSTVFFSLITSEYLGSDPDEPDGLYAIPITSGELVPIQLGDRKYGTWLDPLQTLAICEEDGPRFYNPGSAPRPIPALQDLPPSLCESLTWWPAPDGSKVAVVFDRGIPHSSEVRLVSPVGDLIASTFQTSGQYFTVSWLPDGTRFLATTVNPGNYPGGALFLHADTNGWQPEEVPIEVSAATPVYVVLP